MSAPTADTSRDEEIARALQMSIDTTSQAAPVAGTFAALPPEEPQPVSSTPATAAAVPAAATTGTAAGPAASPLLVAKLGLLVRTVVVTYGVWWVYSVLARAWWFVLDLAFVFVPLGWLGVARHDARLVRWFYLFLAADLVFQLLFPFVYAYEFTGLGLVTALALVVLQAVAAYYVRRYSLLLASHAVLPSSSSSSSVTLV